MLSDRTTQCIMLTLREGTATTKDHRSRPHRTSQQHCQVLWHSNTQSRIHVCCHSKLVFTVINDNVRS